MRQILPEALPRLYHTHNFGDHGVFFEAFYSTFRREADFAFAGIGFDTAENEPYIFWRNFAEVQLAKF